MPDMPPITLPFIADLTGLGESARRIARNLLALADDLAEPVEPQDGAAFAAGEPDDGLTLFEVRLRSTSVTPPRTEQVRASHYGTEDGWVTFYAPGACPPAIYARSAVESVRRA